MYRYFVATLFAVLLLAGCTTIQGDPVPPSVAWTTPAAGATISGSVTLTAAPGDGATRVQFLVNNAVIGESASGIATLDSTAYANGDLVVEVRAFDANGRVSSTMARVFTIQNEDPDAPVVAWQTPNAYADVYVDRRVDLAAFVSDATGTLEHVAFYAGDSLLYEEFDLSGATTPTLVSYTWSSGFGSATGLTDLVVEATNGEGVTRRVTRTVNVMEVPETPDPEPIPPAVVWGGSSFYNGTTLPSFTIPSLALASLRETSAIDLASPSFTDEFFNGLDEEVIFFGPRVSLATATVLSSDNILRYEVYIDDTTLLAVYDPSGEILDCYAPACGDLGLVSGIGITGLGAVETSAMEPSYTSLRSTPLVLPLDGYQGEGQHDLSVVAIDVRGVRSAPVSKTVTIGVPAEVEWWDGYYLQSNNEPATEFISITDYEYDVLKFAQPQFNDGFVNAWWNNSQYAACGVFQLAFDKSVFDEALGSGAYEAGVEVLCDLDAFSLDLLAPVALAPAGGSIDQLLEILQVTLELSLGVTVLYDVEFRVEDDLVAEYPVILDSFGSFFLGGDCPDPDDPQVDYAWTDGSFFGSLPIGVPIDLSSITPAAGFCFSAEQVAFEFNDGFPNATPSYTDVTLTAVVTTASGHVTEASSEVRLRKEPYDGTQAID